MRVMVLVKATKESEAGELPAEQLLTDMGKFNEELVKAGIMLSGDGLHPSSQGFRVRFSGKERSVTDGPFAETKELVAGFWMWQVKSMEEAIEWVKRCPNPMTSDSEIEIRRVYEFTDFGESFTPELQAQEERMRGAIDSYKLDPPRFENGSEKRIAGLQQTYTFETRKNIPALWEKLAPHLGKVPGQVGKVAYGVTWGYQPEIGFNYLAGVEVSDNDKLPAGFSEIRVPAERYAVFTHGKHVSSIGDTLDAIWTKWLPNSGFQPAATPCIERYTEAFDPTTGTGGIEIWLPIKS